jgi:hypothetical protein
MAIFGKSAKQSLLEKGTKVNELQSSGGQHEAFFQ